MPLTSSWGTTKFQGKVFIIERTFISFMLNPWLARQCGQDMSFTQLRLEQIPLLHKCRMHFVMGQQYYLDTSPLALGLKLGGRGGARAAFCCRRRPSEGFQGRGEEEKRQEQNWLSQRPFFTDKFGVDGERSSVALVPAAQKMIFRVVRQFVYVEKPKIHIAASLKRLSERADQRNADKESLSDASECSALYHLRRRRKAFTRIPVPNFPT